VLASTSRCEPLPFAPTDNSRHAKASPPFGFRPAFAERKPHTRQTTPADDSGSVASAGEAVIATRSKAHAGHAWRRDNPEKWLHPRAAPPFTRDEGGVTKGRILFVDHDESRFLAALLTAPGHQGPARSPARRRRAAGESTRRSKQAQEVAGRAGQSGVGDREQVGSTVPLLGSEYPPSFPAAAVPALIMAALWLAVCPGGRSRVRSRR
jgi:hypothetical protein